MSNAPYLVLPPSQSQGRPEFVWIGPAAPVPGTDIPLGYTAFLLTPTSGDLNPNHYAINKTIVSGNPVYTIVYAPPAPPTNVIAFFAALAASTTLGLTTAQQTEIAATAASNGIVLPTITG